MTDQTTETEPRAPVDRAALSAKLWEIAEHHIVAEWICCEPLEPGHNLCAKGYEALGMVKSLLVDADPGEAWNPSAPLLDALAAVLPTTTNHDTDTSAGPAALREVADFYERTLEQSLDPDSDPRYCTAVRDVVMGLRRVADETAATEAPCTCFVANGGGVHAVSCAKRAAETAATETQAAAPGETDEERADREETERDHARGDHTHCGLTCEVELPTEHLRNFVIAKGYPGTAGALAELERRAAAKDAPVADLPARLEAVLTERYTELGNPFSRMRRQDQGPDGWPAERPVGPHHAAEALRELLATDDPQRCAHCTHPKGDHDGRADHRAKHSPLVAGDPWCHVCNAQCDYAAKAQQDEPVVTVHAVPLPGSNGISACCGRPPCEFVGERVTRDPDKVTCTGPTAGARQAETVAVPCVECGHPQTDHGEGEDPVTPGHCRTCPDDDAWHDYQAAAGARQDGAQP